MHYSIALEGLTSGTTPATYKTIVGMKLANTTGHRARLRSLIMGGDGVAPQDLQVTLKLAVADNTGDGTATDSSGGIAKRNEDSIASRMAALGSNYSAEPTTYGRVVWQTSFNARGTMCKEWPDPDTMPEWGKDETLGLLITIGSGSTAVQVSATLEWEEH